ncbi:hypothetical protein DSM106972_047960 [Dulcicalothrix desertica PCC 7102]|uniref:Uncharacterized protein n=1 Tax=Dulcicalothrix desertica PCC 7102 TaxID=232991 RepID=A0A3S1ALG5_9CYAN|nr:hypothetical protein [Dulcicalothrix desertica]RUT03882.1 hypothetical protein DSM106972_047960 [Dulcicalothrix desertica PCC 7102]TWH43707.1 hypothetical protein CAL7102_07451 [Dulcicalothrix desertica PCC 7102]
MTTENQGFEVISDSPALGEVNLEQYLSQPYVLHKHADASRKLQRGTIDILEFSSYLKEQNRVMKRKNYKELVVSLGLEGEDRKYLKVGATFSDFDFKDLALIEPATIFLLAKSSKKYQSVIDQLKNETNITQQRVRELIQLKRKAQKEKSSDANGSVWRQQEKGKKYCQIGAIHEEDEFTGTVIQKIVDEKGIPPQTVVRNAMSLVQAYSSAQLVWANNSTELNNDDLKSFFDVVKIDTPNGVEAPNYNSSCTDTESQSPENEEGKEVTSRNEVDDSDISEPVVVFDSGAAKEVNNDVNDSDVGKPVVVFDSGAAKELNNDVHNSDVGEPIVVFDSGADSEVNKDINNSDASQPVVVSGTDLELEEAVIIAEYLSKLETWGEVVAVMENCPGELKLLSWELLDENQKARLYQLKHEFEVSNTKVETNEEMSDKTLNPNSLNTLKVGDKVMWENCYPHLHSWQPFIITKIEGDEARLDYYANSVPLAELSLVE